MKDFLNNIINVGDQVIYAKSTRNGGLSGPHEVINIGEKTIGIAKKRWNGNLFKSSVSPERLLVIKTANTP